MDLTRISAKGIFIVKACYILSLPAFLCSLNGCQGSVASQVIAHSYPSAPRNYKSAGFENANEVKEYATHAQYLAFKISFEDWVAFYKRFPEYWIDLQNSKNYTFMGDYNKGYTAYAFRWNMMKKKNSWDKKTIERLNAKNLILEDDIYKIVFAMGIPERIIWDNDFDILIYKNNTALILRNERYFSIMECNSCAIKLDPREQVYKSVDPTRSYYLKSDDDVLSVLKLTRPTY